VFVSGLLLLLVALVGVVLAIVPPDPSIRPGMIGMALGCGIAGAINVYLGAPGRRPKPLPGMTPAKATILEARGTVGEVAGYQMIELTLEVHPRDGVPFQVKRKFSAGRLGRVEQGRRLDVVYDPANPEKLDLA
jgi:hypothetical protein